MVTAKSPAAETAVMRALPDPELCSVTDCVAVPPTEVAGKVIDTGEAVSWAVPIAEPARATKADVADAKVRVPPRDPSAIGANVTLTVQLAPGATDEEQPF